MPSLDVQKARGNFPALESGYIYGDNAGGSQCTRVVADRIYDYLCNTNVQLGADYSVSQISTRRVMEEGPEEAIKLFNASSVDEIVFGSSSTLNLENLARSLEDDIQTGDEFVVTWEHEANVGPWKKLATRRGAVIKHWRPKPLNPENPYSVGYKIEDLLPLISSKTRIVAISATSNILGSIIPVREIVKAVRKTAKEQDAKKVEISVDCVAYAPHRLIDVKDWDVDFCVFSYYKVYGPHISALYVKHSILQNSVSSLVHHFLKVHQKSYKLQPGGPGYELVYGTTGVVSYLRGLTPSNDLKASFDAIAEHEQTLIVPLLEYLTAPAQFERGVRVVGDEKAGPDRVPTISFVVTGKKAIASKDVVKVFDKKGGIGIRFGHFYAWDLIDKLEPKLDTDDGVVRISLVHYNTVDEVQKIIEILKEILD
ncbi:putative aminotransferase [Moniliophthora roreri MCA 2997]|uniref:Aminotransferase n=2 Tax=Moniliophthora roreri TaxID=221103 RepID=V2XWZ3_MONRO|nr:putative aminotransferase [Moniliophthora roreri MCA 2997]KAI3619020.1 putative aminotransferase [Moniliophthora roreri]